MQDDLKNGSLLLAHRDDVEANLVSVIIPTYNRADVIGRALPSVVRQTLAHLEIIVVDDGSTDQTSAVVAGIGDSRVRVIHLERNMGGSAARNRGIEASHGGYIAFQDSDDEWALDKLEKQMAAFARAEGAEGAEENVGVVYSGFWRVEQRKYVPGGHDPVTAGDIHRQLLWRNCVGTPTAVVKRKCLETHGLFDERLPRFQDWDLFLRISRSYRFMIVDEPLVLVHSMAGSIGTNLRTRLDAMEIMLGKYGAEYRADRAALARMQQTIGCLHCRFGEIGQGAGHLCSAIKARPADGLRVMYEGIRACLGR